MLPNAVAMVEIAVEKQASVLLMPVAARRQLNELPDEMWTKINIEFYSEPSDAFFKALTE
jgi:ATP-dependent Lon protease